MWELLLFGSMLTSQILGETDLLSLDQYHDYNEMTEFLKTITNDHPNIAKLSSIGQSVQSKELWVVELTTHQRQQKLGVPNVKYIGNIHGNEPVGRELILHLIQHLVARYSEGDSYVKWLLSNTRLYMMPSFNPDGFEMAREGDCYSGPGRKNSHRVDLNRNFPDYFRVNDQPREPETEAMINWLKKVPFVLSLSLHGGSLVANYPFDSSQDDTSLGLIPASVTPDDDVFRYLASVYSRAHPTMHQGLPCTSASKAFPGGITNGAAWYPLIGGMQDYNYVNHGCMEITLELSCCKYPYANQLHKFWADNKQAMLMFASEAHRGVRGVVQDGDTGSAVSHAKLSLAGRNITFLTSESGEFWRLLRPGNYILQVEKSGYLAKSHIPVTVSHDNQLTSKPLWLNIKLKRLHSVHNSSEVSSTTTESLVVGNATLESKTEDLQRDLLSPVIAGIDENRSAGEKVEPSTSFAKTDKLNTLLCLWIVATTATGWTRS